jgi:hypothetical protein
MTALDNLLLLFKDKFSAWGVQDGKVTKEWKGTI